MKHLILLSLLVGAAFASAEPGFPKQDGKLPPFYLHCDGEKGGHLTIDTISGSISYQPEPGYSDGMPKVVEYIKVESKYPDDLDFRHTRAVEYIRLSVINGKEDGRPVEYLRKNVANEFKIDEQTRVACFISRSEDQSEEERGLTCQLQDVVWTVMSAWRRLESITLNFPFKGATKPMPDATAMMINEGRQVWNFNPQINWTLNRKCTVFTKEN